MSSPGTTDQWVALPGATARVAGHRSFAIAIPSNRGLGLGSLWFASDCNRVLWPTGASSTSSQVRQSVLAQEGIRSQVIAFALASIKAFPMTHHVEAVALLERHGG